MERSEERVLPVGGGGLQCSRSLKYNQSFAKEERMKYQYSTNQNLKPFKPLVPTYKLQQQTILITVDNCVTPPHLGLHNLQMVLKILSNEYIVILLSSNIPLMNFAKFHALGWTCWKSLSPFRASPVLGVQISLLNDRVRFSTPL